MLPRLVAVVGLSSALILMFAAVSSADIGSPIVFYCLGLVTALLSFGLVQVAESITRWPVNAAIIDWSRVEELVTTADRLAP